MVLIQRASITNKNRCEILDLSFNVSKLDYS